jgi:hypothetical protein
MRDDVGRLVEFPTVVRINEIGELSLAAPPYDLVAVAMPSLRTGVDHHIEVEDRERFPDLATERTSLEFV